MENHKSGQRGALSRTVRIAASSVAGTALALLASCGGSTIYPPSTTGVAPVPKSVQSAQGGSTISVFATAPGTLKPDDLIQVGAAVFVIYQDANDNPDGTIVPGTTPQSVVIEYDLNGNVLQTFNVPGHPDGIVAVNSTTVWVSSNEDGNPLITVINTSSNTLKTLTADVAAQPHGGGFDDMKLVNGVVYSTGSNPTVVAPAAGTVYSTDGNGATTLNGGVNTSPMLYALSANADGTTFHAAAAVTAANTATTAGGKTVTLSMTDPDSMALGPNGTLVIDSQGDSELVFVSNLGTANQSATVLLVSALGNPVQLDDIRWAPASSTFMLLTDGSARLVYQITPINSFNPGTAYAAAPGALMVLDPNTGVLTPLYTGMKSPKGILFIS